MTKPSILAPMLLAVAAAARKVARSLAEPGNTLAEGSLAFDLDHLDVVECRLDMRQADGDALYTRWSALKDARGVDQTAGSDFDTPADAADYARVFEARAEEIGFEYARHLHAQEELADQAGLYFDPAGPDMTKCVCGAWYQYNSDHSCYYVEAESAEAERFEDMAYGYDD